MKRYKAVPLEERSDPHVIELYDLKDVVILSSEEVQLEYLLQSVKRTASEKPETVCWK